MNEQDPLQHLRGLKFSVEHSTVPGRMRLRCADLKGVTLRSKRLAEALRNALSDQGVDVRHHTGSVIIRFDPSVDAAQIIAKAGAALDAPPAFRRAGAPPEIQIGDLFILSARAAPAETTPGPEFVPKANWHALPVNTLAEKLGLESLSGLSTDKVPEQRARFGGNVLRTDAPPSQFKLLIRQFDTLPVKMLVTSAVVSIGTGGVFDALATLSIVAVNGVLGYVTEGEAERTLRRLTEPTQEKASVIRDGVEQEVLFSEVVPGDRLVLRPGTQIAADARIVGATDLLIDESALTGESVPVDKTVEDVLSAALPLSERANMAYTGTLVANGSGEAVVVATGRATEVAQVLLLSEGAERPRAPIEDDLDKLGARLAQYCIVACGVFFGIGALRGYGLSVMLKDALALAVAAVPEGLPAVATTTLALGLRRMEKKGILIRRLDVVETIGAVETICLDKTGTLTANRMTVEMAIAGGREWSADAFTSANDPVLHALAESAALNNDAGIADGEASPSGSSPTEHALLEFAIAAGADVAQLREQHPRLETVGRSAGRRFMSTVHPAGPRKRRLILKGSPEELLDRCGWQKTATGRRCLEQEDRERILAENKALAARPSRVLGFAEGKPDGAGDEDPRDLTWLGLVSMVDPIRPGAKDFIKALHRASIDTVLITGDQAATAEAVARDLDLSNGAPVQTVDSAHIEDLDPELLAGLAKHTHVFARVSPRQKLHIVCALQAAGRVVAMTGDGVNDGPALKAANVGIAMGESGTDLARDVANVVITDDELPTLIDAIAQGRALYRNIRRSIEFLVTTNLSEIVVEMIEAIHGPGELETPLELLWINLASDVAPGLGLALADPDFDAMSTPPRDRDEPIIPERDHRRIAVDTATLSAMALTSHFVGLARHGPGPQTRGMTFVTLAVGQLLFTLGCQRTDPRRLDLLFENRPLDLAVLSSIGFTALPFFVPPLGRLLGVAPLAGRDLSIALTAAVIPLARKLASRGLIFPKSETIDLSCKTSS